MTDTVTAGIGAVLDEDAPEVGVAEAQAILRRHYGLAADVVPLPSERDHNFLAQASGHQPFVLKIAHPGEARSVTHFQTAALRHIAEVDPDLAVPRIVAARGGADALDLPVGGSALRVVRLLTYMPGTLLIKAAASPEQDRNLGRFLARLGLALRGFFHPAAGGGDLLWDIRQIGRVRTLLPEIVDPARRALAQAVIERTEALVLARLAGLRAQVVHNDLNPSNVVVEDGRPEAIAGVLDFGDMLHGPLICDLAIGATYRWHGGGPAFAGAARFAAGYNDICPLDEEEIAILPDLIRARIAQTVTIANWQGRVFPAKAAYVLRLHDEMWALLERLATVPDAEARAVFDEQLRGAP